MSWIALLVLESVMATGSAHAAPMVVASEPPCAAVFGDAEARARNEARRARRALQIVEGRHAIDVIYRGTAWSAPTVASLPWLAVERILPADPRAPSEHVGRSALMAIPVSAVAPHAHRRCARALPPVVVDSQLAPDLVVLAVLDAGLLVERIGSGELFFVVARGKTAPAFRMALLSKIALP